jgi:hypothetical protein
MRTLNRLPGFQIALVRLGPCATTHGKDAQEENQSTKQNNHCYRRAKNDPGTGAVFVRTLATKLPDLGILTVMKAWGAVGFFLALLGSVDVSPQPDEC